MGETGPTTSAELKKEWLNGEKAALAPLGFKHAKRDFHRIRLADDRVGEVAVHKRAVGGGAVTVLTDAVSVTLDHAPTQRLMRELYGRGAKDPGFIILAGGWFDVPSDATCRRCARYGRRI